MNEELKKLPSKVPLEQFDVANFSREKIRELFRSGKLPTAEMLVEELLLRTVKAEATDLHLEPLDNELCIRLTKDGIMRRLVSLPKEISENIANVLKTKALLNAFEKKKTQEGRFSQTFGTLQFDIRINAVPVMTGERFALRFLNKGATVVNVEELGFSPENLKKYRSLLSRPSGLLLIAGPASSGKTTTAYAGVKDIQTSEKNIVTVENPIEYRLDFASQVILPPDKTFTFIDALRAAERQNPNVMLIGEIRNAEVGVAASEAALNGNLVISTILSGDALGSIYRLLNIGVSPYWLATTLAGIVYQQLVRKICPSCKEEYTPNEKERTGYVNVFSNQSKYYHGKGCDRCDNSGYVERTAIHEILVINDQMRDLIFQEATMMKLREAARMNGFQDIFQDAIKKVADGTTTIAEFMRALG